MTTAVEVMKYIKSQMSVNGEVQLQKLAYYAQAWSLAWDGRPLFNERIEAWRMGPVVPALRFRRDDGDPNALDEKTKATVDAIIEFYGKHHGQALADMTHNETPWAEAWEKRPAGANSCDEVISHDAMRRFYTQKVLSGSEVPVRRSVSVTASDEEVVAIARANAERWRDALTLLAQ